MHHHVVSCLRVDDGAGHHLCKVLFGRNTKIGNRQIQDYPSFLEIKRSESQMDHGQLSMVADKFQWVFSESLLNACGTDVKFCRRMRTITPFRLGLALTATCASHRVETVADLHCGFNALFGTTITY